MEEELNRIKAILKEYKQEHLLFFYDELTEKQKNSLLNQLLNINFQSILKLCKHALDSDKSVGGLIAPLSYKEKSKMSIQDIEYYSSIGRCIISDHHFAVVTLAGGQGTRLGLKGPKGAFELDLDPKKSLFEILCDDLKEANKQYGVTIPWYIMTSEDNYEETINFFREKNYFNYDKENIFFFNQGKLPIIDMNGKLILEETYKVKEASNGNGDVFSSLAKNGLITNMKSQNIQYVFISGVDNVICNIVDPLLIGLTVNYNVDISAKTMFKKDPLSNQWVFAKKNNKPAIIDCRNFGEQLSALQDKEGNYLYRDLNMLAHLFSLDAIDKLSRIKLPYHLAFRKNAFVNEEGMKQVPDKANTYKFETFIFDAFEHFDKIQLLRVEESEEFAPIKDFIGPHNPEVAKELYEKKYNIASKIDK